MQSQEEKSLQISKVGDYEGLSRTLRLITGWTLLAAAAGVFIDAAGVWEGLISLYIGFPIGAVGLVLVFNRVAGRIPAILAGIGFLGFFVFMFSYPEGADWWISLMLVGVAHLFLPLAGRFVSLLWISASILGFPAFGSPTWGVVSAYTVFGVAAAASGASILWALEPEVPGMVSTGPVEP